MCWELCRGSMCNNEKYEMNSGFINYIMYIYIYTSYLKCN